MTKNSWSWWENLFAPVAANLLTALLLLVSVLYFRDPIYEALGLAETSETFPLHCVAEPYMTEAGDLVADLYLFNLRAQNYTNDQLSASLAESDTALVHAKPEIQIEAIGTNRILGVLPDEEVNQGKGVFVVERLDDEGREWSIRIESIVSQAVVKWHVETDSVRGNVSRSAKGSAPFKVFLAGERM